MFRLAAIGGGSGVLAALLLSQNNRFKAYATSVQRIPADENALSSKWDSNWDHRNPIKAMKPGEELKPTAKRTLLLIRHGQYETWQEDSDKRILTALGREQARLTGERLKELNLAYSVLYSSTMPRAKETAGLIAEVLPQVPRKQTDLLSEGAPIRPEPPSKTWKPEQYVSTTNSLFLTSFLRLV